MARSQSDSTVVVSEAVLAKLSPHGTREINGLKTLLCNFLLHRWYYPNLDALIPAQRIGFYRWCPAVNCHVNDYQGDFATMTARRGELLSRGVGSGFLLQPPSARAAVINLFAALATNRN
jgi:hypothetical protein